MAPEGAVRGGAPPELRRRRRPGATVHQNTRGLDREEEENGAKLTRCSMTAVGRWRGHRGWRGGRCGAGELQEVLRFGEN
jgi:hypothetical protein